MNEPIRTRSRAWCVALLIAVLSLALAPAPARADGDPGSDVLVDQNLFVAGDAGLSVAQQVQLGSLLQHAGGKGFPVRVAIISSPADLGAITALWRQPRAYARFLGIELSLAYKQRLLVVMPNGFGFNWPGHSTNAAYRLLDGISVKPGGSGLFAASTLAVRQLAAVGGVKLGAAGSTPAASGVRPQVPSANSVQTPTVAIQTGGSTAGSGHSTDNTVAGVTAAIALLIALGFGARAVIRRRRRAGAAPGRRSLGIRGVVPGVGVLLGLGAASVLLVVGTHGPSSTTQHAALESNPYLDPGTRLSAPAPGFTLVDQFGRTVSLRQFRGRVVILAFTDSECTTICPMTTTAMVDAKAMLGPRVASQVQLLGVDANPASTSVEDVASYSELHGMTDAWQFLTGSLSQLRHVWRAYKVEADIERGLISHTPALFIIGPQGDEAKVYLTQQSYAAIGQLGQILAHEVSGLLPSHPKVHANFSYAPIPGVTPAMHASLPRYGGGTVPVGPGRSPHLYLFFATWDQEITSLAGQLEALNNYRSAAASQQLPPLTAIDEGSVEPSNVALSGFLHGLPRPLSYPVAIDATGRVADGYQVLGQPWFVLTSPSGRILWYWQVSTSGWPTPSRLAELERAALARTPAVPTSSAAIAHDLAGSPAELAQLHRQASQLLGSQSALGARIRALRGYPVVLNAWASWCTACRSEFNLFAAASALYGRRVAFLGADTNDSAGDARVFLAQHPVSYPSYQTNSADLNSLAAIEGLPTTIYISAAGKVVDVHTGQYDSQGTLDDDITAYALPASG